VVIAPQLPHSRPTIPDTKPPDQPKVDSRPPPQAPAHDPAVRLGRLTEASERELRPGDRFKECETCPEMIVIPRGDFMMGSNAGEPGHEVDEAPVHKVTISARIAVARYAVTVADFETFVAVTGYRPGIGCRVFEGGRWTERSDLSFRNPGFPQGPNHPVVCVNWNDAKAYTDWMTARMSGEYRLPTEAEREYATRAASSTAFWWGNDIAPSQAGYDWTHVFGNGPRGQARRGTHPVDAFQSNPWGLFQMHGNVSEWVEDCWNDNYRGAPIDGSAWQSGDCRRRVLRGGSWGYVPKDLRASYREGATLSFRNFNFAFRVVRVLRGAGK
jgi:formylglycine-generating enzyme required for sulfatase activity